jgi:hypothetical protein
MRAGEQRPARRDREEERDSLRPVAGHGGELGAGGQRKQLPLVGVRPVHAVDQRGVL